MTAKRLRIVILNYNQPEMTVRCAQNCLTQNYQPMDVVVVDNGSLPENCRRLAEELPAEVHFVQSEKNLGYAAGNNIGAREIENVVSADYTIILNNDAFFDSVDGASVLVSILEKNKNMAAVSPIVRLAGETLDPLDDVQVRRVPDYITCLVTMSWWLRRLPGLRKIHQRHVYRDMQPFQQGEDYECESINGCCFIIRNFALREIGYLDEGTFLYFEELILGWQLQKLGYICGLTAKTSVLHLHGETTKQRLGIHSWFTYNAEIQSQIHYCKQYLKAAQWQIHLLYGLRVLDYYSKKWMLRLLQACGWQRCARG